MNREDELRQRAADADARADQLDKRADALESASQAVPVDLLKQIRIVIRAAYTGSAEHGSFLRHGGGEMSPNAFLVLEDLEAAMKSSKPVDLREQEWQKRWDDQHKAWDAENERRHAAESKLADLREALKTLSAKWRRIGQQHRDGDVLVGAYAHEACADELDAALARAESSQEPKQPNPCPTCGIYLWNDPRPCWHCAYKSKYPDPHAEDDTKSFGTHIKEVVDEFKKGD